MNLRAVVCLFALAACQSDSRSSTKPMCAKLFFEECTKTGWSVTYPKSFGDKIETITVPWVDPKRLSAEELEAHLDRALGPKGFYAERIGPPTIRVLSIRPSI